MCLILNMGGRGKKVPLNIIEGLDVASLHNVLSLKVSYVVRVPGQSFTNDFFSEFIVQ